jgi:hypothetical protein
LTPPLFVPAGNPIEHTVRALMPRLYGVCDCRGAIQVGIEQADRGEVQPLTYELIPDIKSRGRERLSAKERKRSS